MDSPTSSTVDPSTATRPGRRTALGLVLLVLGTLLAFTGAGPLGSAASAQAANNNAAIQSWNAYANYPNTLPDGQGMPAGCTAFTLLEGLSFSLNGGAPVANMRDLPTMVGGDVLSMDWSGWTEGCETLVTLSVKAASTPDFQPTTDQALVDFAGCSGADDASCTVEGGYHLELTMPATLCNYQTDAVVGPPLDVVGPSGSYYSNVWRFSHQTPQVEAAGPDMLISADNGGPTNCAPPAVAEVECNAQGASLEITNPSLLNTVRAEVFKNGISIQDPGNTDDPALLIEIPKSSTVPVIIPATPADGTFRITVVVAGDTIYDADFTNDCTDVTVGAVVDCEAGTITLTATNEGVQPVTFTATASTPTGGEVDVPLVDGVGTVAPSATESTTITFFADGVQVGESIVIPPCTPPAVAPLEVECQEGVVEVSTTQPTGYTVVFDVTATVGGAPVDVIDNGDGTFTIPTGGEAADVLVTADGEPVFDGVVPGCDDPDVDVAHECEAGTITVTATQPADHTVELVVTANGTPLVLTDGTATTPSGDSPVRIVVTADGETLLDETIQPCDDPEADATVQCSNTTITVTTTQPTDHTVEFGATANGTPLTLTNGTATTGIGATPVTIVVTADGTEIHRETIQPCTEVQGVQQTRTPTQQLPRTGADESGRMALAIGMVILGFGLVLAGEDRRLGLLRSRS
jgi:membrane-bound inhibitor of C-type lysozyme